MTADNPTNSPRFALLTEATMTPRQRESYQGIVSGCRRSASTSASNPRSRPR